MVSIIFFLLFPGMKEIHFNIRLIQISDVTICFGVQSAISYLHWPNLALRVRPSIMVLSSGIWFSTLGPVLVYTLILTLPSSQGGNPKMLNSKTSCSSLILADKLQTTWIGLVSKTFWISNVAQFWLEHVFTVDYYACFESWKIIQHLYCK